MKEIEEEATDEKIYRVHGLGESTLLKWPYYPKAIYRFDAISLKIPMPFIHRNRTNSFMICMETQKVPNSQNNLEKEEKTL